MVISAYVLTSDLMKGYYIKTGILIEDIKYFTSMSVCTFISHV